MKTQLSPKDLKRLQNILEVGHRLEKIWFPAESNAESQNRRRTPDEIEVSLEQKSSLIILQTLIANLAREAEAEELKRLAFHSRNLTADMTAKHLAGILVPFERLRGKALRDDDFLVDEGDQSNSAASIGPMRVIADNLRSAFNVGSLLRTAECFGVEEVILTGYTPTPDETKTAKTSLGAQDSVKWSSRDLDEALFRAREQGYEVVALETVASATPLADFKWPEKSVLLLGNERFGLDDSLMAEAQHFVRIPLYGRKNSLNVGIAAGVALADWREKLQAQGMEEETTRKALSYKTIGTFRAASVHKYEAPRQGVVNRSAQEGVIELRGEFAQALKDLDGFERIWIVYDFHHNKNWKPLVLPPRGSHEKRGVFATRSPYRPNSIGLSCVELVRVEGTKMVVRGHDLLDATPVLDVKPYIPYADSFPESKTGWLEGIDNSKFEVLFSQEAFAQLEWLEANGVDQLRGFLVSQLEFDPTDSERKRVVRIANASAKNNLSDGQSEQPIEDSADVYQIAYRTWRAYFRLEPKQNDPTAKADQAPSFGSLTVERIASGYTPEDFSKDDDKYGDHALHRLFKAKFPSP